MESFLQEREVLENFPGPREELSDSWRYRKKHKYLTVLQRLDILKKLGKKVSAKDLAEQYGVTTQTIYTIRRNAANFVEKVDKMDHIDEETKKIQSPKLQRLYSKLYTWFIEQSAIGNIMSDKLLQQKAEEFNAKIRGPKTFRCNRMWVWRFKKRHGLIGGKSKDDDAKGKEEENSCQCQDEDVVEALDTIVEWSKQFDLLVQSHANGLMEFFDQERENQ